MENSKLTQDEFAEILIEMEREAEQDNDFDIDENYDEMMELAIEYTYNHFMELGYTLEEIKNVHFN